jgi:hypothetical protein
VEDARSSRVCETNNRYIMNDTHEALKLARAEIQIHLESALLIAQSMHATVQNTEGDSDLNRYLSYYLMPGLQHWLTGSQAGNMKFLAELFERRESEELAKTAKKR